MARGEFRSSEYSTGQIHAGDREILFREDVKILILKFIVMKIESSIVGFEVWGGDSHWTNGFEAKVVADALLLLDVNHRFRSFEALGWNWSEFLPQPSGACFGSTENQLTSTGIHI